MSFFKGLLAKSAVISLLAAVPALAIPRPPAIATAGDDPGFYNTGLTSFTPIEGRGYSLNATFSTFYDSNMLRVGNGFEPRPGTQKADFRFSPTVTGNISLPFGRQQFFAGATIGTDIYANNGQLNRNRYIAGGGLNLRAGSMCTATVAGNFTSRQVLLSQLAQAIPNVQNTLSYGMSANCQAPAGLGAGITLRRINNTNDAPERESFDVNQTIISPQISYARPALGTFSLSGSINYVTYPTRFVIDPDGMVQADGADIFSGRFGYQRALGSRLSISAGLSYLQTNPQPNTIVAEDAAGALFPLERESFSGLGYDFSVSYTPSPRLSADVVFSRESTASPNVGALFQVQTAFGADVSYRLGSAISVAVGGTYNIRDYQGSFASVDEEVPRQQDNISRIYGRVSYNPRKFYTIAFLLAYQNRVSDPALYSFDSISALLTLSVNFGRQ